MTELKSAKHKWDEPKSKVGATCLKCGISRCAVHRRYNSSGWEYSIKNNSVNTLVRPNCIPSLINHPKLKV